NRRDDLAGRRVLALDRGAGRRTAVHDRRCLLDGLLDTLGLLDGRHLTLPYLARSCWLSGQTDYSSLYELGELDRGDADRLDRAIGGVGLSALEPIDDVHAVADLAEDRVLAVEP